MNFLPDLAEHQIGELLARYAGKGFAGHVVKERASKLRAPEAAVWTGNQTQLALLRSGRDFWLEVRNRLPHREPAVWLAGDPIRDSDKFPAVLLGFVVRES